MPTYAYQCKSCNHEFEEFQSISEPPLVECPSCKKHTVIRIIGAGAGLVFKGSGFYLTDYKKTSSSPAAESGTAKKSDSKPESKSDSKAESKPDSSQSTKE
ncbi:MAG: zinc ribbon domain-containing protein [Ignavibacteriae bacterium]|nr:zinc ribbon domain-containing protein [Ignavibacteria bacterium]MBI3365070.1 zinc ribbon domain-containing protein [Ignavibacteriota bacterium]